MNRKSIRAAVAQAEVAPTLAAGLERTEELAHQAAREGAELIVFPKTWLPGYLAWLDVCRDASLWNHAPVKRVFAHMAENSVAVPSPALERLGGIARVEPVYEREQVLVAELELGRAREESMTLDVTGHYHRPELFDFSVRRSGRRPAGEG